MDGVLTILLWAAVIAASLFIGKYIYAWYAELKLRNKFYEMQTRLLLTLVQSSNPNAPVDDIAAFLLERKIKSIKANYTSGNITEEEMNIELTSLQNH